MIGKTQNGLIIRKYPLSSKQSLIRFAVSTEHAGTCATDGQTQCHGIRHMPR